MSTRQKSLALSQAWEAGLAPPYANINEGPFVIKHNNRYYLTYSANHYASVNYGVGYAYSHSPEGPWIKYTGNPILQKNETLVGTGHHSLFTDTEGNRKIVYHSHYDSVFVHPRKVHIGDLSFQDMGDSPDIMKIITPDITALKH